MELSSESKAQDNIGCCNMMWVQIACYWNKLQFEYLKEGTSRKTGINYSSVAHYGIQHIEQSFQLAIAIE